MISFSLGATATQGGKESHFLFDKIYVPGTWHHKPKSSGEPGTKKKKNHTMLQYLFLIDLYV